MEYPLARFSSVVVFAMVPVMIDFMNEPPNITIASAGKTVILYGNKPSAAYPMVRRENASRMDFLNPILSA